MGRYATALRGHITVVAPVEPVGHLVTIEISGMGPNNDQETVLAEELRLRKLWRSIVGGRLKDELEALTRKAAATIFNQYVDVVSSEFQWVGVFENTTVLFSCRTIAPDHAVRDRIVIRVERCDGQGDLK